MTVLAALTRSDLADYVSALFVVYIVLIFVNILISYVPRMPYNRWLRGFLDFVTETTNPYLNIFRRILPPVGGGGFALDLSPMIGLIVLFVAQGVLVALIRGVSRATRAWLCAGALCLFVIAVDQTAKAIVEHHIVVGEKVDVLGPLKLTLSHNRGVAFGLAGGTGLLLVVITLAALGLVGYVFSREPTRRGMWVATGLLAGGALGNLVDRIRVNQVTDFIELPSWPPFNLADMAITAGVILLVLIYLRDAEREPASG